jgi:L-ascorbate metabolism protein UlaG (beta-lactamase superfamily)
VYSGGSELPATDPAYPTTVQVKYLGAGGVVIKRGADVIVTAPFFSNPSIPRVALGEIAARPDQIKRFLDRPDNGLAGAKAILVGHAHYDHLMDVPYIWSHYAQQATIYGNTTMKNTLAADTSMAAARVVSVESDMGTHTEPGKWFYPGGADQRVRFMALKSEHAPIFWHIKFFEGNYDAPLHEIPTRAFRWRQGQTLAYLIDFMSADGKTVEFRVHYQDAASTPPLGFPPDDGRRVDLALVCMPGFNQVNDYPEGLMGRLKPRFVVLIHWEDFFSPLPDTREGLRTVAAEDAEGFLARLLPVLHGAPFKLPAPGAWMSFPQ